MSHPYKGKPAHCFWSGAMTAPAPGHIDPVTRSAEIRGVDRVATMGSCFAQHLSRHIQRAGYNYFVAEPAPADMARSEAQAKGYGVFSARYGNVYTVRQAIQLFDRAFGRFTPLERVWQRGERFVDAFRPQIEPEGHATPEAVLAAADAHLARVKAMFLEATWLVFTLGLTEGWRSRQDGAVFPVAPGVAGGSYDPAVHEFFNDSARTVSEDLQQFIERLHSVNPGLNILLTVSPVPLVATFEDRHVLVSTTYSKAALRVAADEAERQFERVIYFPSYEIITSPAAAGRYFEDDLRGVTEVGVGHVMHVFERHFFKPAAGAAAARPVPEPGMGNAGSFADAAVVCDEELIERAIRLNR